MILNDIKTGKAYDFASYLANEAEGVFFSLARPIYRPINSEKLSIIKCEF